MNKQIKGRGVYLSHSLEDESPSGIASWQMDHGGSIGEREHAQDESASQSLWRDTLKTMTVTKTNSKSYHNYLDAFSWPTHNDLTSIEPHLLVLPYLNITKVGLKFQAYEALVGHT